MGACEIQCWGNPITDKHPILELTFSKLLHVCHWACLYNLPTTDFSGAGGTILPR